MASVVLSADGRRVATTCTDGATVWDADTGKPLLGVSAGDKINDDGFPPAMNYDGSLVAFDDFETGIWDVRLRRKIDLPRKEFRVFTSCFGPDGKRLVVAGYRHYATVWSVGVMDGIKKGADEKSGK